MLCFHLQYYATQNSKEFLKDVRIPLLLLNNLDDPVIHSSLPGIAVNAARVNPWLIHVCTNRGGHLGWLQVSSSCKTSVIQCLAVSSMGRKLSLNS
jgi:predicted alpha/beta-fold hydrolase